MVWRLLLESPGVGEIDRVWEVFNSRDYGNALRFSYRSFIQQNGDAAKTEINEICSAHDITIAVDEDKTVSYCGCKVTTEGELVILFAEGNLGTNVDYAIEERNLEKALNNGPLAASP